MTVTQYTKDHLQSIISLPPDWPGNDTTQMILGVLAQRQRVSSSPLVDSRGENGRRLGAIFHQPGQERRTPSDGVPI